MAKNEKTAILVDGILRFVVVGSSIGVGLFIPNLLIAFDKPLDMFSKKLDKRAWERELRRVVTYMKSQDLIRGDYEHGLIITERGRQRLNKLNIENLEVEMQKTWDGTWRIVLYDIPEDMKTGRDSIAKKLRCMGFYQLQRSVWLHPFPCRSVVAKVAMAHGVEKYVTHIKTGRIARQQVLIRVFRKRYPNTKF